MDEVCPVNPTPPEPAPIRNRLTLVRRSPTDPAMRPASARVVPSDETET